MGFSEEIFSLNMLRSWRAMMAGAAWVFMLAQALPLAEGFSASSGAPVALIRGASLGPAQHQIPAIKKNVCSLRCAVSTSETEAKEVETPSLDIQEIEALTLQAHSLRRPTTGYLNVIQKELDRQTEMEALESHKPPRDDDFGDELGEMPDTMAFKVRKTPSWIRTKARVIRSVTKRKFRSVFPKKTDP